MSQSPFKRIAVAIAFSPRAEANICETKCIADQLGAELILIHVGADSDEGHRQFNELISCADVATNEVKQVWRDGDPVKTIADIVREEEVDLLVSGALPKEGLFKYFVGSIARKLCRAVDCSVLLMTAPQKKAHPCRVIAVNTDMDACDGSTVNVAFRLADCFSSEEVHLVQELNPHRVKVRVKDDSSLDAFNTAKEALRESETVRLQAMIEGIHRPERAHTQTDFVFGKPGVTLAHYAQSIRSNLIVTNAPTDKSRLIDRVFMSGIEYILGDLPCDIMLVRKTQ